MTGRSLGLEAPFDIDMTEEVRLSYESVKNVDVLDVSSGMFLYPRG
jgi:dynein heavy chain 1